MLSIIFIIIVVILIVLTIILSTKNRKNKISGKMENNQNIKGTVNYIAIILTIMLLIQMGIIGAAFYYFNEMNMF